MVPVGVDPFCYRNMVLLALLQIYGVGLKESFCYGFMVAKDVYPCDYIYCMAKHFRNMLHAQPK